MLFAFLKYIKPTWYYNLTTPGQFVPYFVDYCKLNAAEQDILKIDDGYCTAEGLLADAAYQAWYKGIIKRDPKFSLYANVSTKREYKTRVIELFKGHNVKVSEDVFVKNINDNYRFIRRYFNPAIAWYILLVRLFSIHNPVREVIGFIRSIMVKRVDLYHITSWVLLKEEFDSFNSQLVKQQPKVSVIIPTLNRYSYLKNILRDLEKQQYTNFEVIICDQSDIFDENFYKGWNLDLKLIRQQEKALWLARNSAVEVSNGPFIAFSEDDVRIDPDWIQQHIKCIDFFKADISAGVFFPEGSEIPVHNSYFRWADQFATGNAMLKRDVFFRTGLFDRQFEKQRSGDGEFGLRCYLFGYTSVSNPLAFSRDVKASTGGLRETGSWDSFRPTRVFAPRPVPSILYLTREYFGNHLAILMLMFSLPGSLIPYKYKANKGLKILAYFSFFLIWPLLILQVLLSWQRAGKKIKEGHMIKTLSVK